LERKVFKKLKNLWKSWRKRDRVLIGKKICSSMKKERNLALEKSLTEEKTKVEKLFSHRLLGG